jgi:hypothetical protein
MRSASRRTNRFRSEWVPMTRKSPQEKKALDYQKDRRNTYGENSKSSRKAIHLRKAWVNRSYRRDVRAELAKASQTPDPEEHQVDAVRRKDWKKSPDEPLGEVLRRKQGWRVRTGTIPEAPPPSLLQQEAATRLRRSRKRDVFPW